MLSCCLWQSVLSALPATSEQVCCALPYRHFDAHYSTMPPAPQQQDLKLARGIANCKHEGYHVSCCSAPATHQGMF